MIKLAGKIEKAFSLTELLAAMLISTLVLTAALGLYGRIRKSADNLHQRIDRIQLPREILQRIAEDIDNITGPVSSPQNDIALSINNKLDNFYQTSQLVIERQYYNPKNQKQTFDKIIWQTNYNYDANGLVLYRSHQGLTVEDKLFDENKDDWQKELFIPVTDGLTYFKIEAFKDKDFVDKWSGSAMPKAIRVSLSFTPPYQDIDGKYEVDDLDKEVRTIAVNRARNISFKFVAPDYDELFAEPEEPNEVSDFNEFTESEPDINDFLDFLEN
ncbi:MAG: hypothetical protein JW804_07160 [Sedimentisphaerales bacterium]|nr:hypothetical protein [Sedimentisphaerales bacterium]